MRDRFDCEVESSPTPDWLRTKTHETSGAARVLVVEDDRDIRDLIVTLLELAGYSATAFGTAEEALEELRTRSFAIVLTDYALPNHTGGWLLGQARSEGLLEATPVLVVTAHPNPTDVAGFEVVQKPFDLEDLVERVRRRLEASRGGRRGRQRAGGCGAARGGNGHDGHGCPDPIELILYVSGHSLRTAPAIADIRRVIGRFSSDRVTLTICDLDKGPSQGARDTIAFTPTLARRSPGPRTFILGHLSNPQILMEVLADCELRDS